MRSMFRRILCAGFLISLVSASTARSIASGHADHQDAQNTDPKTQRPSPDPKWVLTGKIGDQYGLRMEVRREDDRMSGRYRYLNKPKAGYLILRGAIDKSGSAELSEYVFDNVHKVDKKTGTFKGAFTGDIIGQNGPTKFAGAWTNANESVSLEFRLGEEGPENDGPTDSSAGEDRVNVMGKLHILRQNHEFPVPKNVSLDDEVCCYYRQPLITGEQPAQVLDKIRSALDFGTVYGVTIASLIEDELYQKDDRGKRVPSLNEIDIDYQVIYNENYILSFSYERYDAFPRPRSSSERRVFDLKTGDVVRAKDIFRPNLTPALARVVDQRFQWFMKRQLAKYREESSDEEYNSLKNMLAEKSFSPDRLDNFTVDGQGVTFYYAYGVSPFYPMFDTEILTFDYEELKGYINPEGILGQFISKK
jgi:hypothetical protein